MIKKIFFFFFIITYSSFSQNTIGTILNTSNSYNAYTLFTINKETYLINNCGQVINQWTSQYNSGKSVYLLENGNLLRASAGTNPGNISIPGIGGRVELFNWSGAKLWEYEYSNTNASQHHDIFPMPNGNILILAASKISEAEALELGRDPSNLPDKELYNENVIEITPVGTTEATIVWEWHFKDHFIQDFDNTKSNFGSIKDNPQLMNINFLGDSNGAKNWMHINSVQYNEELDQIILGSKKLNEIYIIDHSTTTAESASHSGGKYNKGGDLLYRWGNPISYNSGTETDKKLFGQHNPHWIAKGLEDEGKIILYNNGIDRDVTFSEVNIIVPPTTSPGVYIHNNNTKFGPENPEYIYGFQENINFYSPILSSAQKLPNGNILICEGTKGHFFEIDSNKDIVWSYINPVGTTGTFTQGETPTSNSIFRAKKYALDYPAFDGKDLTPGNPIEINPDLSNCSILSIKDTDLTEASIFPNPFSNEIEIKTNEIILKIELYDYLGKKILETTNTRIRNLNNLNNGVYILKISLANKVMFRKIIKK